MRQSFLERCLAGGSIAQTTADYPNNQSAVCNQPRCCAAGTLYQDQRTTLTDGGACEMIEDEHQPRDKNREWPSG